MSLQPFIDKFFTDAAAREMAQAIRTRGAKCDTVLEYGSRGGVSGLVLLQSLIDGRRKYSPRYMGVDLINDESIKNLKSLAERNGVTFNFWQGHSRQYPIHEADIFSWDTFHCGGNLIDDLNRVSPYIHKYIFILGTKTNGEQSEAVLRKVDIAQVAKELMTTEEGARMGLNEAIEKFLKSNSDWERDVVVGQITILKRTKPVQSKLFAV